MTGFFLSMVATAQKPHFVYLQSDNNQPFFVMLNNKNYSSSTVGHVIIPGLTNGSYSFTVGYPGQNASQAYDIDINNTDLGFIIKSFDQGKNYGLLNLQTAAVQLSGASKLAAAEAEKQKALAAEAEKQKSLSVEAEKQNALAAEEERQKALAAEAALKEEQRKADELAAQQKAAAGQKATEDSIAAAQKLAAAAVVAAPMITKPNDAPPTEVKTEAQKEVATEKTAEVEKQAVDAKPAGTVTTGTQPIATGTVAAVGVLSAAEIAKLQDEARRIDSQGKRDSLLNAQKQNNPPATTVAVPVFLDIDFTMSADSLKSATDSITNDSLKQGDKAVAADSITLVDKNPKTADEMPVAALVIPPAVTMVVSDSAKTIEVPITGAEITTPDTVKVPEAVPVVVAVKTDSAKVSGAVPAKNPNCVNEASDSDIELVGMLIKSEKDVEESLELARKTMKLKCATTAQVRKLALLFENQEERYRLLDGAYKYTSDRHNYGKLADLLTDTYYLNRFKAMLQ